MHHDVKRIYTSDNNNQVTAVAAINNITGETSYLEGDYFFSTMPVQELIGGLDGPIPEDVKEVAAGLQYRDFITVGILLKKLSFEDKKTGEWKALDLKDTWIYIQEKDVKVGRLQLFNNWSPYMVKDPDNAWVGMEFFCNKTDDFWKMKDEDIKQLAISELEKIGLATSANVLDATVLRMEKTYPAYFGTYDRFDLLRGYVDRIENLFLVGRNGMHKYNNSDHSMLTAMVAVDNIAAGVTSKENIWSINTEQEYHEEKANMREKELVNTNSGIFNGEPSFSHFVFKLRENRAFLMLAIALIVIQFVVFKFFYPFANYMPDSYSYIEAAWSNSAINTWPIGYSKFLRIFSTFFQSDLPVLFFQYIFLQLSVLYFIYTLIYFLRPTKLVRGVLIFFFLINPLFLFISNYISADAIFTAISLIWIVQIIWLLFKPSPVIVWLHGIVLFLAFATRYNALYYPVIGILILSLIRISWKTKLQGIAIILVLIGGSVWHSANKYKELTDKRQISSFGGWQLAANALFAYSHVKNDMESPPAKFATLHRVVKLHLDSLSHVKNRPDSALGIYYLWGGPLISYLSIKYSKDTITPYFKKWSSLAPLYGEYGEYLIKRYPVAYARYFLWPNVLNYSVPPFEFLSMYNMKVDSVGQLAKDWFGYKSLRVKSYSKDIKVVSIYPAMVAIINILFLGGLIGFVVVKGFRIATRNFVKVLVLIFVVWLANFCFSIMASPIVLRYQLFPMVLIFSVGVLLVEFISKVDNLPAGRQPDIEN